ncbi:MAG: PKD domain-containing protein, partial [Chloroflexi bacterium]
QDWLITPAYDFSAVSNAVMTFDVAYARYDNNLSDTLGLYYSTDCGATFHQLWRKGGSQLATAPDNTNAFVPTASQWRTETVNLSLLNGEDYVQFAFINFSGWGNNLYLDNINIPAPTSNAPIAEFTANTTTIPAGGSVNFTDLSLNNPTSWSWTFQGGTPGTSSQQNPSGIVYNTPGTYTVSLTVSNAYGNDTETKTNYITVTQGTSATCDTLSNIDAGDNLVIYLSDNWGYVAGHNGYGDLGKADYFSNAPSGYEVTGVLLGFARATYGSPSSAIQVHVWDNSGPGGAPGNSLASENLPISTIAQDVSNGAFTWVSFSNPPVISGPFYVGITFDYSNPLDTVALIT